MHLQTGVVALGYYLTLLLLTEFFLQRTRRPNVDEAAAILEDGAGSHSEGKPTPMGSNPCFGCLQPSWTHCRLCPHLWKEPCSPQPGAQNQTKPQYPPPEPFPPVTFSHQSPPHRTRGGTSLAPSQGLSLTLLPWLRWQVREEQETEVQRHVAVF